MEGLTVDGCELDDSQSLLSLRDVPDTPGVASTIFEAIAAEGVMVDLIVQSIGDEGHTNMGLTVPQADLETAQRGRSRASPRRSAGPPRSSRGSPSSR